MAAKKIALFIDADNISAKFGKQIIDALENRGEIFIRRIYGNWEKTSLHGWNECILNFSLRTIQQPDYVAGKNATDMSLAIDAMDMLYGGKAEIFALASNDSDFTPLAIRLREGGMKIIGIGNGHASNSFRVSCDEFIDLDATANLIRNEELGIRNVKQNSNRHSNSSIQISLFAEENIEPKPPAQINQDISPPAQLAQKISPTPAATNPKVISISESQLQSERDKKIQQIHDTLQEAAKIHGDASGFSLLNYAGTELKNKNLGFTVRDFGYNQLKDFISAFSKLYEVKGDSYRCLTAAPKIFNNNLQPFHDALDEAAELYSDEKGFVDLSRAGDCMNKKNLSIKNSGHSTISKFIAAFPNLYEVKGMGSATYYRCRTKDKLQPIHEVLREMAKTYTDLHAPNGFTALNRAGQRAQEKNLDIKNFGYSSWSKFVSDFPTIYEVKKLETTIYYRCL